MSLSVTRGVYHYGGDKVVHGLYDVESLLQEKRRAIRVGEKVCHRFQLCVVGDVDQGKTSTVRSLTGQDFRKELPNTEGVDVRRLASITQADRAWTVVGGSDGGPAASSAIASESGEVESLLAEHVAGECSRRARELPAALLRRAYATLIALSLVAGPLSLAATGYTTLAAVTNVACACVALGVTCTSVRLALSFTNVSVLLLILPPLGSSCDGEGGAALMCVTSFVTSAVAHFSLGFLTGFGFGPGLTTGATLMRAPEVFFLDRRRLVELHFGRGDALGQALAIVVTALSCCTALVLTTFWKQSRSRQPTKPSPSPRLMPQWSSGGTPVAAAAVSAVAVIAAVCVGLLKLSHAIKLCPSNVLCWFVASFFAGALTLVGVVAGRRGGAAVAPLAITPWQVIVNIYAYFVPGVATSVLALWLAGWTLDSLTDAAGKICLCYGLSKVSAAFDYLRDVAPPAVCAPSPEAPSCSSVSRPNSSSHASVLPLPSSAGARLARTADSSPELASVPAAAHVGSTTAVAAIADGDLYEASLPPASFRMVIRDFAGHSVYRPMQQAFMPRCSFYLVVFSWLDADSNVDECAARLGAWLALVLAHVGEAASGSESGVASSAAAAADGTVLLVGTHAADVDAVRRRELDALLQRAVPTKVLRLLRCRSADELAFSVENSLGPNEPGVAELRHILSAEARLKARAFFPRRIPLRWWEWLGRVAASAADSTGCRHAAPFDSADRLYDEWRCTARDMHQVDVLRKDFDDMIAFFHDIGEVYMVCAPPQAAAVASSSLRGSGGGGSAATADDAGVAAGRGSGGSAYVFLDVQFIADAAAAVAAGAPLGAQPPSLRAEWRCLSTRGVCRLSFLRRIVDDRLTSAGRQPTTAESFAVLASLLERLDLLHRVEAPPASTGRAAIAVASRGGGACDDGRQDAAAPEASEPQVFVPERLPLAAADQLWAPAKPCDQQVDLYVRVDAFTADQLFYRLLCRCAAGAGAATAAGLPSPSVGSDGGSCSIDSNCRLSLYRDAAEFQTSGGVFLLRVRPGCRNSVVVVSVRAQSFEHCAAIVRSVSDALMEIVARDFPYLSWSLNVLCPLDGHKDSCEGYRDTGGLHLIHSSTAFADPDAKVIAYCRGRPLVIHRYKVVIQKLFHRPSLNSVVAEDIVEKLVVEQLNTDDFKRLSSALGLGRIEVDNIMASSHHSSRDGRLATMRLWMSRKGEEATYAALVQALETKELREAASYVCLLLENEAYGSQSYRSGSYSRPQTLSCPSFMADPARRLKRHEHHRDSEGGDDSNEPTLSSCPPMRWSDSEVLADLHGYEADARSETGTSEHTGYAVSNDDR